jgi:tyrosine-protein phosphatase SIW14
MYKCTASSFNKPVLSILTLFLVLVLDRSAIGAGHLKSPTNQKQDLPNFHAVHPYLFRGGEPSQAGLSQLKQKGIKTVIDLRATSPITRCEKETVEKLGMNYVNLPMDSHAPTKSEVDRFLSTVEGAANSSSSSGKKAGGPVFVHCAHGSDRTGCMIGIWRVAKDGWNYDQAYREMRKYYFGPQFKELSDTVQQYASPRR